MNKKIQVFIYFLIAFVFLGWNDKILPYRYEISNLDITRIISLDNAPNPKEVMLGVVKTDTGGSQEGGSSESKSNRKENIVSISAESFVKCMKILQNYGDKQIPREYIKHIVIGEDMAKEFLKEPIDFLSHDLEIRPNSNIYIARGDSAVDLLSGALNDEYEIADKINNIISSVENLGLEGNSTLTDVIKMFISDNNVGVIPSIKLLKDGEKDERTWFVNSFIDKGKSMKQNRIVFSGYAIVKEQKIIDFLKLNESRGYNTVTNKLKGTVLDINKNEKKVSLTLTRSNTDISFDFDQDKLTKIIVKVFFTSNLTETDVKENIFKNDVPWLEAEQSDLMKKEIEAVVNKSRILNADFLEFGERLKMKHPYKWRVIKEDWEKVFSEVPVQVEVSSEIRRTYDLFSLTKEE